MASSWRQLQTWDMYAALIAMAVVALVIDRLFLAVRAWLLRWTDEA
jgi:ABC-type nitrate/sulfonate/bicarbonate transport system permease component